ncbi:heterokaryon incompatibility protein-domain-containing protein [Nemania sp. FL0031]|nr:heterokaryon incompatibility protein-domain-containing protein [Nemania sp. FL0031]
MRLLRIRDDGTLTLTKDIVRNEDIPPYTILSHTWGRDDQEVSFADMIAGKGKDKQGYRKIEFCSNQTQIDGLRHFWIDTCCIDKTSSAELTEAINSMFCWYQCARKCYVYLADVGKGMSVNQGESALGSDLERELRASKWFTRGWTLQELLAPRSVEFFGSGGQRLGSRQSLKGLISKITGIAIKAFEGKPIFSFQIEERMSWSKGRKTTRPEDRAYSLLGVFGVYMTLIYGENETNAFERLRQEIRRHYKWVFDRLPIAEGSAFDAHSKEPYQTCQPDTRTEILHHIDDWMKDMDGKTIFWLNGMAGTGKSTIARTVARRATDSEYLGASFFFKRGERDRIDTSRFFSTIAAQLARKEPSFAYHLGSILREDLALVEAGLERQFENLIIEPFSRAFGNVGSKGKMLIVVDALDECDSEANVKQVIDLFSCANRIPGLSWHLRIFATSRPDIPVRLGFEAVHGTYEDLILHEVPESIIQQDLSIYFQKELATIRTEYNRSVSTSRQLPADWPNVTDVQTLVSMATPLFIFAATIVRFLTNRRYGNPDKNLQKVLRDRTKSQESKLDDTYRPVLDMMLVGLPERERTEALQEFQVIVGSIVVLAEPLPASALAALVDLPQASVDDRLDMFHSVLDVPSTPTLPVRLLHLSFRDFLTDPGKREQHEFWIDEKSVHKRLAADCLKIMDTDLRKDIREQRRRYKIYDWDCAVKTKETTQSAMTMRPDMTLRPAMAYACRYWADHLKEAGGNICEDQVYSFLHRHFLYWLQALAIEGEVSRSVEIVKWLYETLSFQQKGYMEIENEK